MSFVCDSIEPIHYGLIAIIIIVLLIGFMFAYTSEIESQDCTTGECSHWVHDNKSRWRQNITLNQMDTIHERMSLFYSVVEWRRTLIVTIVISLILFFIMSMSYTTCNSIAKFILSFVYIFIVIFFISMYYQDMWKKAIE